MIDSTALANELTADPVGLGYEPHRILGQDSLLAELLNQPRVESSFRLYLPVPSDIVRGAISQADRKALSADDREHLNFLLAGAAVDFQSKVVRAELSRMFGSAMETRARLLAIGARIGTRWEELGWDHGPTALEVSEALAPGRLAAAHAPNASPEALLVIPGGPTAAIQARMHTIQPAIDRAHDVVRRAADRAVSDRAAPALAARPARVPIVDWLAGG